MPKRTKVPYTRTYTPGPPPPPPPPAQPQPPFQYQPIPYDQCPPPIALTRLPNPQPQTSLPPPPPPPNTASYSSDPICTTVWGPIKYNYNPASRHHRHKSRGAKLQRREGKQRITLSGWEETCTTEMVEGVVGGGRKRTWVTNVRTVTFEVERDLGEEDGEREGESGSGSEESDGSIILSSEDEKTLVNARSRKAKTKGVRHSAID